MNVFGMLNLFSLVWKWLDEIHSEKIRNSRSRWSEQEYEPDTYPPIIQQSKLKINKLTLRVIEISAAGITACSTPFPANTTAVSGIFKSYYDLRINGNEIPKRGIYS